MTNASSRGQALVMFTLFLTVLLGGTAFVVDVGGAWSQGREQQKVADAAALAGATAEANGGSRDQIIAAAMSSAESNGFQASEVTVNIPPVSGAYAPGGSKSGPLSTNDCSTVARYPCWVEVVVSRAHQNAFAGIPPFNQPAWQVTERGVAVGGVANGVVAGIAPLMFNYRDTQAANVHPGTSTTFCEPGPQCLPKQTGGYPTTIDQFAWTTFCLHGANCNVTPPETVAIINGTDSDRIRAIPVYVGMPLGPHNNGNPKAACDALVALYPTGADLPVAISDDDGKLVGFWIWHFDPTQTDCSGGAHAYIGGWFVADAHLSLPLTINPNAVVDDSFGQFVVRLVE